MSGTACTMVWKVGKREVGGKHPYQRLPPTRFLCLDIPQQPLRRHQRLVPFIANTAERSAKDLIRNKEPTGNPSTDKHNICRYFAFIRA